jgi:hypothetical protein
MGSQIPLQVSDSIAIISRAAFGFKYRCDIDILKHNVTVCVNSL